jgi:hypothetical protein
MFGMRKLDIAALRAAARRFRQPEVSHERMFV